MKRFIFLALFSIGFLSSCNCKKTTAGSKEVAKELAGSWELDYISGPRIAFDGLYPDKKPQIVFDFTESRVSGNNSCNSFSGKLNVDGNKINFNEPMAMTKMFCEGGGENTFMEALKKVNTYSVTDGGKTLNFIMGDIAIMRFHKVYERVE